MQVIWKETLKLVDEQSVLLPEDAKILCVQVQNGLPCLWFKVSDTSSPNRDSRTFMIYGTGHKRLEIEGTYIGTFQLRQGTLVFHLFEKI